MNAQRLSRIAAGVAIVTALGVVGIITRNVLWPEDPDASLQRTGGKVLGDMAGYVGRVDRESRTVDVSTSPLGIRPVVMVVTGETAIVVNGKQGAIGDLWKDLPVRVHYEVRNNTRYATSIQVSSSDALAVSPAGTDPAPTNGPAGAAPAPTPPAQVVAPAPSEPVIVTTPPAAPSPAPPTASTPATTSPRAAPAATAAMPPRPAASSPAASKPTPPLSLPAASRPTPPPSSPAVAAPAAPVVPAGARVVEPTTAPSRPAAPATESASVGSSGAPSSVERPAPAEAEGDGSAAIDWLLKGAGRR